MAVVQVFFQPHARPRPEAQFEFIDIPLPDFEQICLAIDAGGLVGGEWLATRRGERQGVRVVVARHVIAFRGSAVERMQLPTTRFVEFLEGVKS